MIFSLLLIVIQGVILYVIIRLAVTHGIDQSKVGQMLLRNDNEKKNIMLQLENARYIEEAMKQQTERVKKLDETI